MGGQPSAAVAVLAAEGGRPRGSLLFEPGPGGLIVSGQFEGLVPGSSHGLHVHEFGDLREGFTSLGSHYNPSGHAHGGAAGAVRHAGDFGNVVADRRGVAVLHELHPELRLRDLFGRSVVLHAGSDDLGMGTGSLQAESLKNGNSGARLAAGVIGRAPYSSGGLASSVARR